MRRDASKIRVQETLPRDASDDVHTCSQPAHLLATCTLARNLHTCSQPAHLLATIHVPRCDRNMHTCSQPARLLVNSARFSRDSAMPSSPEYVAALSPSCPRSGCLRSGCGSELRQHRTSCLRSGCAICLGSGCASCLRSGCLRSGCASGCLRTKGSTRTFEAHVTMHKNPIRGDVMARMPPSQLPSSRLPSSRLRHEELPAWSRKSSPRLPATPAIDCSMARACGS